MIEILNESLNITIDHPGLQFIGKYALNEYLALGNEVFPILLRNINKNIDSNGEQIVFSMYIILGACILMTLWVVFIEFKFVQKRNFFLDNLLRITLDPT